MIGRYALRTGVLGYLAIVLLAPVALIFWRTFEHGWQPFWTAMSNPDAVHALKLTLEIAVVAVPLNTVFGILCALAIVRHRLPAMGLVNALVDLPLALSPVVVGLALVLLYEPGGWLHGLPFKVLFAFPSMLLATTFVSLPFVVREVVPVLREIGTDQEEAAATHRPSRRSARSRCRRSGGRSPTASCSRRRAPSGSSEPSASSRET